MYNFTRPVILAQVLFLTGFFGIVGVAFAGPEVFILHGPIQPANNEEVTYRVTASDPQGIKSIVITVERRLLRDFQNQKISDLQSTTDIETRTYNPPFPTSISFDVKDSPYPDNFHIGYRATATSGSGEISTEGYIYFAAGIFPWPEDPIPIYVRGDPAAKADLVFIPDTDYNMANWKIKFMQDVTDLLRDAFLSEQPFAQKIRSRREMWNFYLTHFQGDAEPGCNRTMPSNWTTLQATVNSGLIVHRTEFRDCAGIGNGSAFSAEAILDAGDDSFLSVPIHELGHSVFSLADEYVGGYLFYLPLYSHNVFPDRKMCRDNAATHGWPKQNCKQIGKTGWFRSDGDGDIMKISSSAENEPGPSGKLRIDWYYDKCTNQNC